VGDSLYYFASIGDYSPSDSPGKGCVSKDMLVLDAIQSFLIRHRLHEVRVLPDTLEKYEKKGSDGIPKDLIDYDRIHPFLNIPMSEPLPVEEADMLPPDLIKRLKNQ